jgi:hypothetical protein
MPPAVRSAAVWQVEMLRSELAMLRHQIANIDSVTARQKQSVELAEAHYTRMDNDNVQLHAENKQLNQQLGAHRRTPSAQRGQAAGSARRGERADAVARASGRSCR